MNKTEASRDDTRGCIGALYLRQLPQHIEWLATRLYAALRNNYACGQLKETGRCEECEFWGSGKPDEDTGEELCQMWQHDSHSHEFCSRFERRRDG